jgi:[ribosomal protein S5]-alanine N-acetyltransferase
MSNIMGIRLLPLSKPQLEALANSIEPEELRSQAEPGAFPPSFVATRSLELLAQNPNGPWSSSYLIASTEDSRIVGACGFKALPNLGRVEVGYGVSESARNNGAATAALNLLSQVAFEAGATEVLAEVSPTNFSSIRVVQKAGFLQVGSRTDEEGEHVIQWLKRSGA